MPLVYTARSRATRRGASSVWHRAIVPEECDRIEKRQGAPILLDRDERWSILQFR